MYFDINCLKNKRVTVLCKTRLQKMCGLYIKLVMEAQYYLCIYK